MPHNKDRALEPIEFIQMLNLTDDFYGQPFVLPKWQYNIIWDVYGTVGDNGYRQYRYAYLEIPKKNGKTTLIAALSIYHLACDGPGGQIYCCAADRSQATLVYKAAVSMIEQNEDLKEMFKITDSRKEIENVETGTILKVLSAEAYSKHGLNPTVVIFDELHAQPKRDLWDTMTFGAGAARKEPLWWVITTAGDDPDRKSIGWEIHDQAQKIIDGELVDPSWYAKIYSAPENADIYDEELWHKINPSLGITIDIDSVRREAIAAQNSESSERLFRWLRLNQWISLKRIGWLPLTLWDSTVGKWSKADLVGKKCYPGLDLASTIDLTGLALVFPPQEGIPDWRVLIEGWIPEDKMKERVQRDGVPYDRWVKNGFLHATPGNAVDYDFVEARIMTLSKQYSFQTGGTDPWNSRTLTQRLGKEDVQFIEVVQNMAGMSPAMKEIERLLRSNQFSHEDNPLARWCFGNVITAVDGNENIKPMKNKSKDRIDVIVAWINAMAVAIRQEKQNAYETRGMRLL
ncbi:terminase large subunit [Desulfosporosinus lacus]|uniref:Phage terminase-like protein, large subunit, contains N-terminal HTH domain n=1 Tax=Desulfosporosinus lacus DSM 15449 TaxID=1121420 RepID=A0A1M5WH45_9FIRM|nr:terminase TerL endonuclease subunit [Desulfosporosinus lacus]SHH86842.1 Phage terminase-like protein, large subunit, contains N-terminal HTH domain [Desulfosporosinus lacus DSM 15449]